MINRILKAVGSAINNFPGQMTLEGHSIYVNGKFIGSWQESLIRENNRSISLLTVELSGMAGVFTHSQDDQSKQLLNG